MNHVRCVARIPGAQRQHAPIHHDRWPRVTTALSSPAAPPTATSTTTTHQQRRTVFHWRPHEWRESRTGQTRSPPIPQAEQPTETSEDGHRTLRKRQYGNRSLPLPAFMDPVLLGRAEARTARKITSVNIDEDGLTEWQRELRCNPYAAAIATPVRQCQITMARLPQHFCLRFTTDYSGCLIDTNSPDANHSPKHTVAGVSLPFIRYWGSSVKRNIDMMHVLSSEKLVRHINIKKNWTGIAYDRIRMHWSRFMQKRSPPNIAVMFQWDRDTPGIVMRDLKREVVVKMRDALGVEDGEEGGKPSEADVEVEETTQKERMLVPLDENGVAVDGGSEALNGVIVWGEDYEDGAVVRAAMERKLRVYRLRDLLAEETPEDIRPSAIYHAARAWGVVKDPASVPLLLALHKLEDYTKIRRKRVTEESDTTEEE